MSVDLSPIGGAGAQFFDNNGVPLAGGKLYTYAAGTTTPKASYTSASGNVAHSNPIILDSSGRVPGGEIWLTTGDAYKFVLETPTGILLGTWDNIYGYTTGSADASTEVQIATAGQTLFVLTSMGYAPGTNTLGVFIDGVNQVVNNAYIETNSTSVTFVSGLHEGAVVKFININIGATDANVVSYEPGFTGSTATTVADKLRQIVSVKDFGAVGDGVTDDAPAFIQACSTSDTVFVPQGQYKLLSTIPITDSMVLDDGAVLVADAAGVYDNIVLSSGSPETAKVFLHLTSARGRFSGGQVKGYSGGTLAAIFSANYQQTISETYITDFPFGIYADNHSSFYLNNIIENCTIGFKGMETNFNGDTIAFNHFEVCATCIYLDNGPSGGQIDSCFINNNLFNFYSAYGVRLNSSVADFHHVIIDNNYFEAGGTGTSGVKLEGTGYYTNVCVTNNMTLGTASNSYFVRVDNNTPCELTVSGNSAFNHLYVVYTKQGLVAEENHGFGNTNWYEYGKAATSGSVVSIYGQRVTDTRPTTRTRTKVYDIGDQMTGVYTLTKVTNNGAYSNSHWDAGAGPAPAVSYYTGYVYRDFQFDTQMRLGDGWRAELVCRMNPALTSDYYLFGVRTSAGVYSFVLESVGTTPATQSQVFADPGIPRNNWGIRGRVVGQYFSIEAYNSATGVAFASHVFTDATYSIGYAGMYCNSLASAGEAYVIQNYIGPY